MIGQHGYKCANCWLNVVPNVYNGMWLAHFCHLPGLGQVGHCPRETSRSAGTLDWGPMWPWSQYHGVTNPNIDGTICINPPVWPQNIVPFLYTPAMPPMCDQVLPDTPVLALMPLTPLVPPAGPHEPHDTPCIPCHLPLIPLHPCQWECCDPGLRT